MSEALKGRLKEIGNIQNIEYSEKSQTDLMIDAEEVLRKIMVGQLPKFRKNHELFLTQLLNSIFLLQNHARTNDYRYLDAWNNIYEEINYSDLDFSNNEIQLFLLEYKRILLYHINDLKS